MLLHYVIYSGGHVYSQGLASINIHISALSVVVVWNSVLTISSVLQYYA